jgi:hypothetical protein
MVFSAETLDRFDFLVYNPQGVSGLAGGEVSIRLRILKLEDTEISIRNTAQKI